MTQVQQEITFSGKIDFGQAVELYRRLICVGLKSLHNYNLYVNNRSLGIELSHDYHIEDDEAFITVSDEAKEKDLLSRVEAQAARLAKDIKESQSADSLVANSPKVRFYHESGRWRLEDIAKEEIESLTACRFPKEVIGITLPVRQREIRIRRNGIYAVTYVTSSGKEAERMIRDFDAVLKGQKM